MSREPDVVLVTGGSSGIGRALARAWARRGARVFATSRRPDAMAPFDVPGIEPLALDVTDPASIDAAVARVLASAGRIDVLVNNAGYGMVVPMLLGTPDALRRQLETNVVGPAALVRAVAPGMVARGHGLIVNVGSVSGVLATPFAGAYCASKAALHAISDAMRMELAPLGVAVVMLQPGAVRSGCGDAALAGVGDLDLAGSPYEPVRASIEQRATSSQDGAMDADVFAERVVALLARANPPSVIRMGRHSVLMPLLRWLLPVRVTDRILSRRFGLGTLRPAGRGDRDAS